MPGYRADVQRLCSTFWILGYDLRVYVDLTAKQMLDVAKEKTENNVSILNGYASLFVCILAHGDYGDKVIGVDGQPVEIKKLQDAFVNADNLKNKLKCFIVQACRGNQVDVPPSPPTQARVDNLHNLGIICYLYH